MILNDIFESGPFSYGVKKPRKGSVADLAAKKRQEQEKDRQPAEPRDQRVGVARVVKDVAEGSLDDIEDTKQLKGAMALAKTQKAIRQAKDGKDAKYYADGTKVTPAEVARRAAERKAKKQGVAEAEGQQLSVNQLAMISDEALDNAYGYGRSAPGNTFGWQANLMSAAYAKKMIDAGVTDIEKIADAIHKGWNVTAQKFVQNPDQFDDTEKLRQAGKLDAKLAQRAKLMKIGYFNLDNEEQEKDRVVARALLQAIKGEQGMAENADLAKFTDYDVWSDKVEVLGAQKHMQKNGTLIVAQTWDGDVVGEFDTRSNQGHLKNQGVAEGEKKPYPKTWHDVDPKLGKQVDKMSQAEKVKKGFAHPDTLKKKGVAEGSAQEKLYQRHQELRKKSGLPDAEYYQELKQTYTLPDEERYAKQAEIKRRYGVKEQRMQCPECGGAAYEDRVLAEKNDACYHKVKSRYKVWPSAYASGALVRCRKVGAANWGNKSKK